MVELRLDRKLRANAATSFGRRWFETGVGPQSVSTWSKVLAKEEQDYFAATGCNAVSGLVKESCSVLDLQSRFQNRPLNVTDAASGERNSGGQRRPARNHLFG